MNRETHAELEFWFEFGSIYSYLSVMRIESAAARAGVRVNWKPFLLGPIFRELGWNRSPFVDQPEKAAYVWKDMARECRKHGLRWTQPTRFPRPALLPLRVALVGAQQRWMPLYGRAMMQLNFVDDRDIDSVEVVEEVLERLFLPARALIDEAQTEPIKLALRRQTDEARALGIFGAPTFITRGEMFWGNDRMDDALAHAGEA